MEIGTSVAAPYATWILAALGMDVVKVEPRGRGDDARQWGGMFEDGRGSYFEALNRDKRGITVDLRDPTERTWLRDYAVEHCDVVLQNLRAGTVDGYGLGAVDLIAANPRMIYCNLHAFGASGPLKDKPGYDPLMQAFGGLMSVTGHEGQPALRVGTSIIDMGTGMWCAIGILASLFKRQETGRGAIVDASLYETALAWMTNPMATAQATGEEPRRGGSGMIGIAPYQAYPCADGELVVAAPNDRLFRSLCDVLAHPEWPNDARFTNNRDRYTNLAALNELLAAVLKTETRDHWQAKLADVGVPSAPVRRVFEVMNEPQTQALGMLQNLPDTERGLIGMPLSFNGERPPLRRWAPTLGEHDDAVRAEAEAASKS
jgi:crotonobetainyl-CoA:carnitine CoA-transferase CaiB-like acyl-CoA transferase